MKKLNFSKKFLIKEYIKNKKSIYTIAEEVNCNSQTIWRYLKKYSIKIRTLHEDRKRKYHYTKKILTLEYLKRQKTGYEIAKKLNCSSDLVYKCLKKFKIKIRTTSEARKLSTKNKGKNHPFFGKIIHGKWGKYKGIWMRSSWEVAFTYWLDLSGIKWLYESKTFDLGNTTYTPDFYLPEFNCYIEIKGYWRDDAKKKFSLFRRKYFNIKIAVLEYKQLKILGVF